MVQQVTCQHCHHQLRHDGVWLDDTGISPDLCAERLAEPGRPQHEPAL